MPDYVGYDNLGDDYVGDDDQEILGAVAPRRATKPVLVGRPSVPRKLRGYIGLGDALFNSTTLTLLTLIVEPQRAFRPERLIISRRDGSSATAGTGARVNGIFIGDQPQSPSIEQPAPTEMFQPDATVSGIDFDVCVPGQKIQLQLSVTALPTGTEFIRLSCGMYGDMMRGSSR